MNITYDPHKRAKALAERGLDFEDAAEVFAGQTVEFVDDRKDYGETRMICYGHLAGRLVAMVYVQRGEARHIVSMRKANDREKEKLAPLFGQ